MSPSQHRGVVVSRNGMIAASQPLAVSAGLEVLQKGGSFVDAALAVSSVLCVTEPFASQLGGDAFVIVYDAATGQTSAFNASGAAPAAANLNHFSSGIPERGIVAASVPGLVDCWFELYNRYGTLPVANLMSRAIGYAEGGFPAGYRHSRAFKDNINLLTRFPETNTALNNNADGSQIRPGRNIVQKELAWSLRQIADHGRDAFYCGAITERILKYSQETGGLFDAQDFARQHTQVSVPIKSEYRNYVVHAQPPVSQGHILLQQLNLISGFDVSAMGQNSAELIHLQVEAKKLAFADKLAYLGDPAFVDVPIDTLVSKEYGDRRRSAISMSSAAPSVSAGTMDHDTTYFCVVDKAGNAISFIQSVFWGFGSAATAPGTGILFNNRMTGFSLDPASPNVLAPGKRTAHTLNAYLVTYQSMADERPKLAFVGGTPGGDIQVQSNLQIVCNMIDFGMNPQQAIEAPRWQHGGAVGAPGETAAETLAIEDRIEESTFADLRSRGHEVAKLAPWGHGSSYQLIAIDPQNGAYLGGSDPRCDGHAAGF